VVTGGNSTAVARQQLCRRVVFPATRELAIIEETFSVLSYLRYVTRTNRPVGFRELRENGRSAVGKRYHVTDSED
jgi:hypothetical protein